MDMLLKKFILFLQRAVGDIANKSTSISLLSVLRKIIEKEKDEKKTQMQNQFDNLGATKMVLNVITEHGKTMDNELLNNFILFMN